MFPQREFLGPKPLGFPYESKSVLDCVFVEVRLLVTSASFMFRLVHGLRPVNFLEGQRRPSIVYAALGHGLVVLAGPFFVVLGSRFILRCSRTLTRGRRIVMTGVRVLRAVLVGGRRRGSPSAWD